MCTHTRVYVQRVYTYDDDVRDRKTKSVSSEIETERDEKGRKIKKKKTAVDRRKRSAFNILSTVSRPQWVYIRVCVRAGGPVANAANGRGDDDDDDEETTTPRAVKPIITEDITRRKHVYVRNECLSPSPPPQPSVRMLTWPRVRGD